MTTDAIGRAVAFTLAPGQAHELHYAVAYAWPLQHARTIPNVTYFLGWPHDEADDAASD